jgi:nucleotide-binding universal stress UspA family protein
MYQTILVTLDATPADETILEHIRPLARLCHSKLILLHVADGWAARQFGPEAVSPEVTADQAYLNRRRAELWADGFDVEVHLAFGDPAKEIIKWVDTNHCDLIAMSTHGHRLVADLLLGTTVHHVRHGVDVPLLLVRAKEL